MKYAYPEKVLRSNKIDYEDPWYVTNTTPTEFDNGITREYN